MQAFHVYIVYMPSNDLTFKDHFSTGSSDYSQYRPQYPVKLFEYLASLTAIPQRAWDCATGTGQCALHLADYYSEVIATDASSNQIANATKKPGIQYRVASAEDSGIESNSVDLITVAQALHWFDLAAFTKEVNRVLKPGGILAVWTYNLLKIEENIDKEIDRFYQELAPYWPPERKMVEDGYKNVVFPFKEIIPPSFEMQAEWNLKQLLGYLGTWSAVKKYQSAQKINPVDELSTMIFPLWESSKMTKEVRWPLTVKIWSN